MPRLVFKNIEKEDVKKFSLERVEELSRIIGCPQDWITFEHMENTVFSGGSDITKQSLYVEISWFKREQEIQDRLAAEIHSALDKQFGGAREITIIFYELAKENYYENGEHY